MAVLKRIRVLLSVSPGMLRDMLIDMVGSQPDIEVVSDGVAPEELLRAVNRENPDVVIVAPNRAVGPREYDDILFAAPLLKVLAIVGANKRGLLFEMRPARVLLGEMSSDSLLNAIRVAVARRGRRSSGAASQSTG